MEVSTLHIEKHPVGFPKCVASLSLTRSASKPMLESQAHMYQENAPLSEVSQPHLVSVRTLVEFVLQSGDLTSGGFQRRDRSLLGTQGHQRVQRSRPDGYEPEVAIIYRLVGTDPPIEVRGRIDGVYTNTVPVIIEEIKTTTVSLHLVGEGHNPLHWAQAQCYAYIYAQQNNLREISIHLTYYHVDSREEKTFERRFALDDLEAFFYNLITPYLTWVRKVRSWQTRRDESIQQLDFPYDGYRPGQRDMAVAVYKAIQSHDRLYIHSPTGVGKTIATLFPAIKAVGLGLATKIFYLTAKTSGRLVAEKTLDDLREANLNLKSVTLTAKEKICFCLPVNCDPDVCIFARGYFDKVKKALEEIDQYQAFTRPVIEAIARKYEICPFEFSLDVALWVDCIICDYNYVFDPRVYLHRFFDFGTEPYIFLVDEAHNLPDRARSMYSAELDKKPVLDLQRTLKPYLPGLAKKLSAINRIMLAKRKSCQAEDRDAVIEYEPPEDLLKAIRAFSQKAEDWLVLNQPTEYRQPLLEFYFSCRNYLRTADYFDTFYVSYFERHGKSDLRTKLFCLDPAPLLATPLERGQSTIFFSATLLPLDYFTKLLTAAADHPRRVFPSPFPVENVSLLIHNGISTKYAQRERFYDEIASVIQAVCGAHVGNYLVFFPSYAYLAAVLERLKERMPERQLIVQDRGMNEEARETFLAQFSDNNQETLVGLAIMGGIFGEGIDLVGDRLIGALVVGVGVPQVCLENDLIKDYFDRQNSSGFAYAYQYPGFNKVLQATGRVIRTAADRGIIILIDERFTHTRYRQLFPAYWRGYQVVHNTSEIKAKLTQFWSRG